MQDDDELATDDGIDLNDPMQVFNSLFVEVFSFHFLFFKRRNHFDLSSH